MCNLGRIAYKCLGAQQGALGISGEGPVTPSHPSLSSMGNRQSILSQGSPVNNHSCWGGNNGWYAQDKILQHDYLFLFH